VHSATGTALLTGAYFEGMVCIFGFIMRKQENPKNSINFGVDLGHLKAKKRL